MKICEYPELIHIDNFRHILKATGPVETKFQGLRKLKYAQTIQVTDQYGRHTQYGKKPLKICAAEPGDQRP